MPKQKRETISVHVRLPADLHRRVVESAEGQSPQPSINSEIVHLLNWGLEAYTERVELTERLARLEQEVATLRKRGP